MKKGGIYNPALSHLLASSGHTDYITVSDRGFPVPEGPERIDLALTDDIPTVLDVLRAVAAEWHVEQVLYTEELGYAQPTRIGEMRDVLGDIPLVATPHLRMKVLCSGGKGTVRTADTCPYANIIIVSG